MDNPQVAVSSQAGIISRDGRRARAIAAFRLPWEADDYVRELNDAAIGDDPVAFVVGGEDYMDSCRFVVYRWPVAVPGGSIV